MSSYNEKEFWKKVGKFSRKAGVSVIYAGLLLYEVLQKPETSVKDKAIIIGALVYFVSPIDAIPDVIPGGFTDDLVALGLALVKVRFLVDNEIRRKAKDRLKEAI